MENPQLRAVDWDHDFFTDARPPELWSLDIRRGHELFHARFLLLGG